jgi:hypothetical protein
MSKEQIILDVYREHCLEQSKYLRHGGTIQEFIDKCKTDTEFSEKWGLKIEERELSVIERIVIAETNTEVIPGFDSHFDTDEDVHKVLDTWNTPTKLITITYNDTKLESYE